MEKKQKPEIDYYTVRSPLPSLIKSGEGKAFPHNEPTVAGAMANPIDRVVY